MNVEPKHESVSKVSNHRMLPTLNNLLENKELKWIFVGGKGGVGKTTCSCSLATRLAQVRESVLLISTDPAHNVSDTIGQQFSRTPTNVNGIPNLFVMEINPKTHLENMSKNIQAEVSPEHNTDIRKLAMDFLESLPGIDETLTYIEIMNLANSMEFSVVVFDTAPTGHTLRLLSFPAALETFVTNAVALRNHCTSFLSILNFFGQDPNCFAKMFDDVHAKLETIEKTNVRLKNAQECTFVCVCTADFLSVYETERLIQTLSVNQMDCCNIIVNQLIVTEEIGDCKLCSPRRDGHKKYLQQIHDLYADFHIVEVPLIPKEVRGVNDLKNFGDFLIKQV